jgi:hypothetical protein
MNTVEMPDRLAENLIAFIRDNHGKLSKRRREGEFRELTDKEVGLLEGIVRDAFEGFNEGPERSAGSEGVEA